MKDAHEFLNFLLNELAEILAKEAEAEKPSPENQSSSEKNSNGVKKEPVETWVHKIFKVNRLINSLSVDWFIYACCFYAYKYLLPSEYLIALWLY